MPTEVTNLPPARLAVGGLFRELRESRGWSIADAARAAGVTWQAVRGWEAGKRCPDPFTWPDLARVYGVTVLTFSKKIIEKISQNA